MNNLYRTTRIQITLLYFGIIICIVLFFSSIILTEEFSQLDRIESFQLRIIQPLYEEENIQNLVNQSKTDSILHTIEIDLVILIFSSFLSYFLAGRTLVPIQETMQKQKQFIADASHELKTPLTAIMTQAEVLLRSERTKEAYINFTKSVLEESQHMSQLTIQLLDMTRSDTSKQILHILDNEMNEMVAVAIAKVSPIAESSHIAIQYETSESFTVSCDKDRVIQLLTIVLDNAIKYNKANGSVLISTSAHNRTISIQDFGVGIEKQHINKIFDRFYRVSNDRHAKGFGLGLAIAKDIADESNATIGITSTPQKGTTVTISFH